MLTSCYELIVRYATFFDETFEIKSTASDEKLALKCKPRGMKSEFVAVRKSSISHLSHKAFHTEFRLLKPD